MKSAIHPETLSRIAYLRMKGNSLPTIAKQMNAEGYRTAQGGLWYPSTVQMYCRVAAERLLHPTGGVEKGEVSAHASQAILSARRRRVRSIDEAPRKSDRPIKASPKVLNAPRAKRLVRRIAA